MKENKTITKILRLTPSENEKIQDKLDKLNSINFLSHFITSYYLCYQNKKNNL